MAYFLHIIYIYANVLNYILFQSIFNKYTLHVLCTYSVFQSLRLPRMKLKLLLFGNFNGCGLQSFIPPYKQYLTCTTCGNKTIDLCYSDTKNAYKSVSKPLLGTSDHSVTQLLPTGTYKKAQCFSSGASEGHMHFSFQGDL